MSADRWIFLLSLAGAIGIPGALIFGLFYSTLGPERDQEARSDR